MSQKYDPLNIKLYERTKFETINGSEYSFKNGILIKNDKVLFNSKGPVVLMGSLPFERGKEFFLSIYELMEKYDSGEIDTSLEELAKLEKRLTSELQTPEDGFRLFFLSKEKGKGFASVFTSSILYIWNNPNIL